MDQEDQQTHFQKLTKLILSNLFPNSRNRSEGGIRKRLMANLTWAFNQTYAFDGVDPAYINSEDAGQNRLSLLSFFGLPTRIEAHSYSNDGVVAQILGNFIGLHHDDSEAYKKVLNYTLVKPILIFLWNLVAIPVKTSWNIITFFTEYLPLTAKIIISDAVAALQQIKNDTKTTNILGFIAELGHIILVLLYIAVNLLHGIGRCMSSPAKAAKIAWKEGNDLGGWMGLVTGAVLSLASISLSVAIYSLIFPLLLHLLINHSPVLIANIATEATLFFNQISSLSAFGGLMAPLFQGLGLFLHTSVIGVGAFLAAITVPAFNILKAGADVFSNWWYRRDSRVLFEPEEYPVWAENDCPNQVLAVSNPYVPESTGRIKPDAANKYVSEYIFSYDFP